MNEELNDLTKLITTGRAVKEYELNGVKFLLTSPTTKELMDSKDVVEIISQYISQVGTDEFKTPEKKKFLQTKLMNEAAGALIDQLFGLCKDFRKFQDELIESTLKKN